MPARKRRISYQVKVVVLSLVVSLWLTVAYHLTVDWKWGSHIGYHGGHGLVLKKHVIDSGRLVLSRVGFAMSKSSPNDLVENALYKTMAVVSEVFSHNYGRRKLCSMQSCFSFSRCQSQFLVYIYPSDSVSSVSQQYEKILESVRLSPYYTTDPDLACLFLISLDPTDRDVLSRDFVKDLGKNVRSLPYWNNGRNHLIFNLFAGTWPDYYENLEFDIGEAIIVKASVAAENFREGFDISMPLYPKDHPIYSYSLQETNNSHLFVDVKRHVNLFPVRRKYLLGFKGKRYVYGVGSETRNCLHLVHNGEDVVLVTTCRHGTSWERHADDRCHEDNDNYERYGYDDLLANSTFCLVPRGRRLGSFRFLEVLQYGCILVSLSNGLEFPFSDVIDWSRASVTIDERMLLQVPAILRSFSDDQILKMRRQAYFIWDAYFSSVEKIVHTSLEILQERIRPNYRREYLVWNYPPGALHVRPGFSTSPARLPFYTSLLNIRPSQKFTAIILAVSPVIRSSAPLFQLIAMIDKSDFVQQILIVWLANARIPDKSNWPATRVTLQVVEYPQKHIGQRFIFLDLIQNDAVFTFDEDSSINTSEIDFAFSVWSSNPQRIVGFASRWHYWDIEASKWRYTSRQSNQFSMVLTNTAILHRYYAYLYSKHLPAKVQELVTREKTCESLAMNFLVSHITRESPMKISHSANFKYGSRIKERLGVSFTEEQYFQAQTRCFEELISIYGYMPLVSSRLIINPLLYRDPVSVARKKYRLME